MRKVAVGSLMLTLAFASRLEVARAESFTHHLGALRIPLTISFVVLLVAFGVVMMMMRRESGNDGGVRLVSVSSAPAEPVGDPFKNAMARANDPIGGPSSGSFKVSQASGSLKAPAAPPPPPPPPPQAPVMEAPVSDQVSPREARKPLKVDMGAPAPPPSPKPAPPPPAGSARSAATAGKGNDSWKELLQKVAFDGEETSSTARLAKPMPLGAAESPVAPPAPPPPPAPAPPPVLPRSSSTATAASGKPKDDDPWKSLLKKVKDDQSDNATTVAPQVPKKLDAGADFMPMGDTGMLRQAPADNKLEWGGEPESGPRTLKSSEPAATSDVSKKLEVRRTSQLDSPTTGAGTDTSSTQKIPRKFLELERPDKGDSPEP